MMITSVADSLKLLNMIAQTTQPTGLSELARLCQFNKSRTFRMLCTLAEQHFIEQQADGTYRLGHQLLVLGQLARQQIGLIQAVEKVAEGLSEQFNENLQLRIVEGNEVVQIWRKLSSQSLQVRSSVGNRRPLGAGAAGKLLLAYFSAQQKQDFFTQHHFTPIQLAELERIYAEGFCLSQGELTQGVYAIAVPIFDAQQRCIASFSLSVPEVRADATRLQQMIEQMKSSARSISQLLGLGI